MEIQKKNSFFLKLWPTSSSVENCLGEASKLCSVMSCWSWPPSHSHWLDAVWKPPMVTVVVTRPPFLHSDPLLMAFCLCCFFCFPSLCLHTHTHCLSVWQFVGVSWAKVSSNSSSRTLLVQQPVCAVDRLRLDLSFPISLPPCLTCLVSVARLDLSLSCACSSTRWLSFSLSFSLYTPPRPLSAHVDQSAFLSVSLWKLQQQQQQLCFVRMLCSFSTYGPQRHWV